MTQFGQGVIALLARALDSRDRDVALGDIAESGESLALGIRDLLGLIVRRQINLWKGWRPWLALWGISGLAAVPISRFAFQWDVALHQQLMAYRKYGVRFETGATAHQDLIFLLCLASALLIWSWTCGFALGLLSKRTLWLTWPAFYLVARNFAWARFVLAGNIVLRSSSAPRILIAVLVPLSLASLLVTIGALCGTVIGSRRRVLSIGGASWLVAAIAAATAATAWTSGWYLAAREAWSGGVWHGDSLPVRLLPLVLAAWPAAYLLAAATSQQRKQENLS